MDLLERTAELVDIPSESRAEAAITNHIEALLKTVDGLDVERVGDNVVARTHLGRAQRLILAGHTDTVPANGNARARIEGDVLWGLGSADMKSGLAVMVELALALEDPVVDVTWVFYAAEEIAAAHNGLGHLFRDRPDLVVGDAALLGEPTGAVIEAGCQGTLHAEVVLRGERAHSARPWMGRNAIHRLGRLLAVVEARPERRPMIDGCEYREALQAVRVEGGVAGNVIPDRAAVTLNHRFAPDRTVEEAFEQMRALVAPCLEAGDELTLGDHAAAAAPGLDHPLLTRLIDRGELEVRAKLGWTDVARFAAAGIPAANFGPGDPTLAHTAEERVDRAALEATYHALAGLLGAAD